MNKKNEGFTLLEAILAITILAIIFIPVISSFTNAVKYNVISERQQQASIKGQSLMEEIKVQKDLKKLMEYLKDNGYSQLPETAGALKHIYLQKKVPSGKSYYDIKIEIEKKKTTTESAVSEIDALRDITITEPIRIEEDGSHSKVLDEYALGFFENNYVPTPYDPPNILEMLKRSMQRELMINISLVNDGSWKNYRITSYFKYTNSYCPTSIYGEDYMLLDIIRDVDKIRDIFVFYENFDNGNRINYSVEEYGGVKAPAIQNFYLVCQESKTFNADSVNVTFRPKQIFSAGTIKTIRHNGTMNLYNDPGVVYTGTISKQLVEEREKLRLMSVKISLYPQDTLNVDGTSSQEASLILDSMKGE